MSRLRHMASRTVLYSASVVAARLSSLITLPIVSRALSPADYGVLEMISTSYWVVEVLLGAGFPDALPYFFVKALKEGTAEDRSRVIRTSAAGAFLLGVAGSLTGYLISPWLSMLVLQTPQYTWHFQIAFLGFFGAAPVVAFLNYLRIEDQANTLTLFGIVRLVINLVLCILLVKVWPLKEIGVLLSATVTSVICALWGLGYMIRKEGIGFSWLEFRRHFGYAFPLSMSGLLMLFIHFGDRYFLQRHTTLEAIGFYGFAYKMGMMVSIVHSPFLFYWQGQMYHVAHEMDGKRVTAHVLTVVTLGLTLTGVVLCVFAKPMLMILAPPAYLSAAALTPGLVLAYIIRGMNDQLRGVFSTTANTWEQTSASVVGMLTSLVCYVTLIPAIGVRGAVLGTLASFVMMLLFVIWRVQRVAPHDWEWPKIGILLGFGGAVVITHWILAPAGFFALAASATLATAIYVAGIWVFPVLEGYEKTRLRNAAGLLLKQGMGQASAL